MFRTLLEQVRREASGERALETVRTLAGFHRVQASPGYDRASEWLASQLASHGLEVETESVPADGRTSYLGHVMPEGWECTRAVATLLEGGTREPLCDYETEKLSLVLRSAPARGRFPIVLVDDGSVEGHYGKTVRDAVVLTNGPVQRVHRLAVTDRGAAGLLCDGRRLMPPVRERSTDPDALNYTSFWWRGDEPRGWGFVVSPRVGERLRERLRDGARLELEVEIESRAFPTTIPLLSARVPGSAPGEVLVMGHLCHPQPSANDNASGAAAVLECARVLATLRARGELPKRGLGVRFLWMPELTGSYAWLARDPARHAALVAGLNLDMVGQNQEICGSTLLIEHPPCWSASFAEELLGRIRAQAVDWVPSYSGPGHYSLTRMAEVPYSGGSDHVAFLDPAVGVPCPMLIQWPDRYYHTSHDTPDKTDPDSLALAVRCAATYAGFLAGAPSRSSDLDWLLGAVARGARTRWLRAVDHEQAGWQCARETERGRAALASLVRLGVAPDAIGAATSEFESFTRREGHPAGDGSAPAAPGRVALPRRVVAAPLPHAPNLMPGFSELRWEKRETWFVGGEKVDHAGTLTELAWGLADGRRTLDEITRLVWLETGQHEPEFLAGWFDAVADLGLCEWVEDEEPARDPDASSSASR